HSIKLIWTALPVLNPLWYIYSHDPSTSSIDLQFFFGKSILVSPVTEENSTTVSAYFPDDIFYDFLTLAPFVNFNSIPLHIRGGAMLSLRETGAMTITAPPNTDFEFIVDPDTHDQASGSLYADDGVSIIPKQVQLSYTKEHLHELHNHALL
ncbi:hypothetical protein PHLCEN_2v3293, partial [Hermanssonia centrifuga]